MFEQGKSSSDEENPSVSDMNTASPQFAFFLKTRDLRRDRVAPVIKNIENAEAEALRLQQQERTLN